MIVLQELHPRDPEFVGPYRLQGLLGVGGMGRVYLGVSPGGRPVAVKVIRADLAADGEFRARFRREITVARQVSSQYTAPVIDADLDAPEPWLATAYVAGPSLSDAVAEYGPLPVGSVLKLAAGLAEGLSAIHAAGVVHRDLKPANVLLADDGPRVIDFGISLGAEASALTRTGLVVGSPGFMSPEQAEGREVGSASDIFSLGAVLAFAATGKGPFGAGSTPALVYRVVHSPASLDHVPAELQALIGRCLAKDPRQRPTARQLLAETAVQPARGWLPEPVTRTFLQLPATALDAPTPAPVPPTSTPARPTPAPAPPTAGISRTATMAQMPTAPAPAPEQPRPREERRRRRRVGRRLALASVITGLLAASAAGGVALAASGHPSSAVNAGHMSTATSSSATTPSARPSTSTSAPATQQTTRQTTQTTQPTTQPTTQQTTTQPAASPTPTASQTMPAASATPTTAAPVSPAPAGTGTPATNNTQAPQTPAAQSSTP